MSNVCSFVVSIGYLYMLIMYGYVKKKVFFLVSFLSHTLSTSILDPVRTVWVDCLSSGLPVS